MSLSYGADLIDVAGGGFVDDGVKDWLTQQSQVARQNLGSAGSQFFDWARSAYEMVTESQAMQMLRNLRHQHENMWVGDDVHRLSSMESYQTAGMVMQRWIMANPTLRNMYLNQEVDGYSDTYVNYGGDAVGAAHYDYRRVMSGVVEADVEGYTCCVYVEQLPEDEVKLHDKQRLDIIRTWNNIERALELGEEDPTSPYGAQL